MMGTAETLAAQGLRKEARQEGRHAPPFFSGSGVQIFTGDARARLREFGDEVFQACVTSPPYWGLRDYEVANQIGSEGQVDDYVEDLVALFSEVRRTLRHDGTLWLNVGDAYTSGGRTWRAPDKKNAGRAMSYRPATPKGLKPKDLIGLPWRLAFALQADGWYLRSDIVWHKPNCQPESVKDRPTRCHEYVFLFSKSERYLYNSDNIQEDAMVGTGRKNRRSVWSVNTEGFKGAHFAVFPPKLVELCILAGAPPGTTVLDPFLGTGTVGLVSKYLRRKCVGIELKREFAEMAVSRIEGSRPKEFLLPLR